GWHVLRVGSGRSDLRIAARGVEAFVRNGWEVVAVDEIVRHAWMTGLFLERLLQDRRRLELIRVRLVVRIEGDVERQGVEDGRFESLDGVREPEGVEESDGPRKLRLSRRAARRREVHGPELLGLLGGGGKEKEYTNDQGDRSGPHRVRDLPVAQIDRHVAVVAALGEDLQGVRQLVVDLAGIHVGVVQVAARLPDLIDGEADR